ncbi:MAG: hypothetical protein IJ607_01025, partial [Bacteroidaceae bacterium]|nr:hypothetical protein [Bacteroidaceae bacterium]
APSPSQKPPPSFPRVVADESVFWSTNAPTRTEPIHTGVVDVLVHTTDRRSTANNNRIIAL